MVSYHTPETKKQSKQWIEKGQPGPIKAMVHASCTIEMLAFFDNKGLIYTNSAQRLHGQRQLHCEGPGHLHEASEEEEARDGVLGVVFHWDNVPIYTAVVIQTWLAANNIQLLQHPPHSLDLAPADFLFRRVKEELAGVRLTPKTSKKAWEGVVRSFAVEEFPVAFSWWLDHCNKCIQINCRYVEKSFLKNVLLTVPLSFY